MSDYSVLRTGEEMFEDKLLPDRTPLAMAFVRMQSWERPMSARDALRCGSAFASLVKPFRAEEVER